MSAAANGAAVHGSVGGVHGGREAATVASVAVAGRFGARRDRVSEDCLGGVMRDRRDLEPSEALGWPPLAPIVLSRSTGSERVALAPLELTEEASGLHCQSVCVSDE